MTLTPDLRDSILQSIPHLRAFAMSLAGNADQADDLVQEAIVRGLGHIDQFQPGTNMQAWLFTILRNQFHTAYRKRRREVEDPEGGFAARLSVLPDQMGHLDVEDLKMALTKLPVEQREALLLVTAQGFRMKRRQRFAEQRSGRSRVEFIVPAPNWLRCSRSRLRRTSKPTAFSKQLHPNSGGPGASSFVMLSGSAVIIQEDRISPPAILSRKRSRRMSLSSIRRY